MLTAFSIKVPEKRRGLVGAADRLRRDRAEVRLFRSRGVTLRHVTYISYSGKVYLERADRAVESGRSNLICSERLDFPEGSGYHRFYSREFSARLCENFAVQLLSVTQQASDIPTALYDESGRRASFLPELIKYAPDTVVVTNRPENYSEICAEMLDQSGASVIVTKNPSELDNRALIIAPDPITADISLREEAAVLSTAAPERNIGAQVFYRYSFRMPNGFSEIKPPELDEEYFCSALYTLAGQYELGSIVPLTCSNNVSSHTPESLGVYLERFA